MSACKFYSQHLLSTETINAVGRFPIYSRTRLIFTDSSNFFCLSLHCKYPDSQNRKREGYVKDDFPSVFS
jgi:hypothetical protein